MPRPPSPPNKTVPDPPLHVEGGAATDQQCITSEDVEPEQHSGEATEESYSKLYEEFEKSSEGADIELAAGLNLRKRASGIFRFIVL